MRFFKQFDDYSIEKFFYIKPTDIGRFENKESLKYALGATLYMPATRKSIAEDIISIKYPNLMSMAICTEDAISDSDRDEAIGNVENIFSKLDCAVDDGILDENDIPLIFVRVKDCNSFRLFLDKANRLKYLTGFIFPKVSSRNLFEYIDILKKINISSGKNFLAMPILETPETIYKETRIDELIKIKGILDQNKELILNVRIGATDFSGLFSVRRSYKQTIYDILVIRDCVSDIINVLLRADSDYVVSGPVWEYFNSISYPAINTRRRGKKAFDKGYNTENLLNDRYIEGLINETILDNVNGLVGKTVIHPSHINIVNALQIVSKEEYEDAIAIIDNLNNGAIKSTYNNKMNEPKPHTRWAKKILDKARAFGVLNEGYNFRDICK